jgi:hypothetical protein
VTFPLPARLSQAVVGSPHVTEFMDAQLIERAKTRGQKEANGTQRRTGSKVINQSQSMQHIANI